MSITTEELRRVLSYDESTGIFTWKVKRHNSCNPGKVAGTINTEGYVHIIISKNTYKAHRLAWQYVHGDEPPDQIDHINGIRDDNRIANLRPCFQSQNRANMGKQKNNSSGYKGVYSKKNRSKFSAQIGFNGKRRHLGYFDSPEIAAIVYDITALELFGPFAKTNF